MLKFLKILLTIIFHNRSKLIAENIALKHQITVLKRNTKQPKIRKRDRIFWILLSKFWNDWKKFLFIVQPETVIKWHRMGFKLYWKIKSIKNGDVISIPLLGGLHHQYSRAALVTGNRNQIIIYSQFTLLLDY